VRYESAAQTQEKSMPRFDTNQLFCFSIGTMLSLGFMLLPQVVTTKLEVSVIACITALTSLVLPQHSGGTLLTATRIPH
jgi:hypothetical protein